MYVLHACIHCGACTQKAQHPNTYVCTSACPNTGFYGAARACSKATPRAACSCWSWDPWAQEETGRPSGNATPLSRCWEHAGSQGRGKRVGFFHQINPRPILAHGNLALEQVCVAPQGGPAPAPVFAPQSSDFLFCFKICSLRPGKLQLRFIGSNCSQPCPKAVAGDSSFSSWFSGLRVFFILPRL